MAPSQMEHQQQQLLGLGYTHKKFNCGYSHKKLGLRLRPRDQENKENQAQQQNEQVKIKTPCSKNLFRPYALDDKNTPRKRKICRLSETSEENYSTTVSSPQISITAYTEYYQQQSPAAYTAPETCASPALSPNSYTMRLQRQRAALYMHYMAQIQQQQQQQQQHPTALQITTGYPMGYPNVTAPIFNGC